MTKMTPEQVDKLLKEHPEIIDWHITTQPPAEDLAYSKGILKFPDHPSEEECGEMREYWDDELCVKCRKKKMLKRTLQSFQMALECPGSSINAPFGWYVHASIIGEYIDKDCDEIIQAYLNGDITLEEGFTRTKQLIGVKE